ncbi:BT_3928 family protein [Sphingobacterium sp. SYP-B4668]|uniref:BT_3928 family protein n=1 Tax=Sphingobacterium sp. SYP-B4668 TaxID=2996035 RepID=UPI0022DDD4E1|nr:BT_3928 family protein [Sphingobacterium sp. SYP-B4668]
MQSTYTSPSKKQSPNYLLGFARIITGLLFIFSGLIKANDPTGFGYKLEEYFHVFHMDFMNDYSTLIAIAICGFEIILGALLLFGFYGRKVAWGLLLLIIFFTFLTFYSAFFEVVTSCGCFGDAIPLTPWQSFLKDLVLLALILIIFVYRGQIKSIVNDAFTKGLLTIAIIVISLGIGIYTTHYLPFIDFLPYKKGNNIPALMILPEGKEGDVYETIYAMKNTKTGETKNVTDKVYMSEKIWEDSNWEIVGDPSSKLIKKGYAIPIPDLMITDSEGTDRTQELITNPYYNFVVVSKDLTKMDKNDLESLNKINQTVKQIAEEYNLRAVLLTASSSNDADFLSKQMDLIFEIFYADQVPLKSMVRSNPGVLLMQNGNVINKWSHNNFPSAEKLVSKYFKEDK